MEVYQLRLQPETIGRLREIPNGSERARTAIERDLQLYDDAILNSELRLAQKGLNEAKDRVRDFERRIGELQALKMDSQDRKVAQLEARQKLLETTKGVKLEHWLDSRVDVMKDCGFKSVEEAVIWVTDNKAKAVR
jgi:hypothetical protein